MLTLVEILDGNFRPIDRAYVNALQMLTVYGKLRRFGVLAEELFTLGIEKFAHLLLQQSLFLFLRRQCAENKQTDADKHQHRKKRKVMHQDRRNAACRNENNADKHAKTFRCLIAAECFCKLLIAHFFA